jgi:V/A-type H+/Na+-transporting ATPase subunit C
MMSSDYGYINARVRGMKSKLLAPEFYNEALDASDFRAFMSTLGQSTYGREIEEAQSRYEGLKVLDNALARNFYQTARSIANFSDGQAGQLVAMLLLRYDLGNIKTIARAKHAGRSVDDIQASLFPAGELKPAVLDNVAAATDMAAVAQSLLATPTPLRGAFARAAANYQSDKDLYKLELDLDRAYYSILLDGVKDANADSDFLRYIKREIDATNLRTALKLRSSGSGGSDELFISGGKEITRAIFDGITNDRSGGNIQGLASTSFAAVGETSSLSQAEDAIRSVLAGNARRLSADPLDIGVVANFLRMKETETAKLRLLGRGKFYNVPRQRLEQELGNA